jgi:hypothetical protein
LDDGKNQVGIINLIFINTALWGLFHIFWHCLKAWFLMASDVLYQCVILNLNNIKFVKPFLYILWNIMLFLLFLINTLKNYLEHKKAWFLIVSLGFIFIHISTDQRTKFLFKNLEWIFISTWKIPLITTWI